jgi:hypothetical protein
MASLFLFKFSKDDEREEGKRGVGRREGGNATQKDARKKRGACTFKRATASK